MKRFYLFVVLIGSFMNGYGQISEEDRGAEFPGGMGAFYDFVIENLAYPKQVQKSKIIGIVFVEFYIDEQGRVNKDSVHIVPASRMREVAGDELADEITSNKYLEKEAVRVIKTSPLWAPGMEGGKPVAEKIVFPVSFDKDLLTRPKKKLPKNKIRMAYSVSFSLNHIDT